MIYAAESQELDLTEICRSQSIEMAAISPTVEFIGPETFTRLTRGIKIALDDDFCGFTRNRCKAGSLLMMTESMTRDNTVGEALYRAFQMYSYITNDLTFSLQNDDDIATITVTLHDPELDKFHYISEWWLMVWLHISSWLIGEEIQVESVSFPHAAYAPIDEYSELFWGSCQFERGALQVQFKSRFLKRRIIRRPGEFAGIYTAKQQNIVSVSGVQRSWKTLIKSKLKESLIRTERLLSIEDLALEFNMSSKTLRRRLEDEGISFRELKEEIRREVVLRWLSEPDIPIGEVSLRAGFAEQNGLVRAVRSWVGVSPKEYRGIVTEISTRDEPGWQQEALRV
jgi:AraC-like DNA-binding protein